MVGTVAGLAGLAAVAGLVELVVRLGWVSPLVVAPPAALPGAFAKLWAEGDVLAPFFVTLAQAFAATLLAALAGIPPVTSSGSGRPWAPRTTPGWVPSSRPP